ncbi:MAG: YihY/virulence factor BrkB family protein [Deltaproteobacteria bacterium]|nr:YihY/virulence factor BrkB family protein [Deltaproteobacteria bacterium]
MKFKKTFFLLKFYVRAWHRLEIMNKAASLSFYTLISMFPMLLLTVVLFSQVLNKEAMLQSLTSFLDESLPYQSDIIMQNIRALFINKKAFSWFGLVSLFLTAQILYNNFGKIVNGLLHTERERNFIITRLFFLLWLFGIVFVLFAPLIFEMIMGWIASFGFDIRHFSVFFVRGGFVLAGFLVFWIVMLILPHHRLRMKRLFLGAVGFALTLQIGKIIFKWVTYKNLDRYNVIYGSLSSMVLVTLWIFYFYNMFLFFVYWVGRDRDPEYVERKKGETGY